ncbi:MAG: haloacid dehalogenase-like hydrolase [Bdellovibrionaceae bacterium]|nr:haloacid dehalogenase-like hydrolase [Pseudobdellovibrionaceae bacterium]MBX3034074.1 haloacid dehalogenase-like hydrolase [Pseudobdellovibrionaceae bacterium]
MNYKQYSPEMWARIESAVDRALALDPAPVAAFDADGTLWDTDLGEAFFQFKIDRRLVPLPPEPWDHYVKLKAVDARAAYLWLAQILKGQTLEQVRQWADQSLSAHHPVPVFSEQKKLIDFLRGKGVRVFIVTASIKWAVEPGARLLGLTNDDVIGIETVVEQGLMTDLQQGILTHHEGKPLALLKATGGKKPFLAAGNTMGDLELIESSSDVRLAVSAAARDDRLFKTEDELLKLGRERGWLTHRFIQGE